MTTMKTKKELKVEYKEKKPTMGVFQLLNQQSGRILLEASTDITARWNRHRTELRFGSHRNRALQNDWNELGEAQFSFSILSELDLNKDDNADPKKEVTALMLMIEEELGIQLELKY